LNRKRRSISWGRVEREKIMEGEVEMERKGK
jgi:hypothetical protein